MGQTISANGSDDEEHHNQRHGSRFARTRAQRPPSATMAPADADGVHPDVSMVHQRSRNGGGGGALSRLRLGRSTNGAAAAAASNSSNDDDEGAATNSSAGHFVLNRHARASRFSRNEQTNVIDGGDVVTSSSDAVAVQQQPPTLVSMEDSSFLEQLHSGTESDEDGGGAVGGISSSPNRLHRGVAHSYTQAVDGSYVVRPYHHHHHRQANSDESATAGASSSHQDCGSTEVSDVDETDDNAPYSIQYGLMPASPVTTTTFVPRFSQGHEWMGRSIETLVLGTQANAPILAEDSDWDLDGFIGGGSGLILPGNFLVGSSSRRRSTASTFGGGGGGGRRRSSQGSFPGGPRRGSLTMMQHGGTIANYYNSSQHQQRRRPTPAHTLPHDVDRSFDHRVAPRRSSAAGPMYRRRSSMATTGSQESSAAGSGAGYNYSSPAAHHHGLGVAFNATSSSGGGSGPNVALALLAREHCAASKLFPSVPATTNLRALGGRALFARIDGPAQGMCHEVAFLAAAIDQGDWSETQTIVSRLAPRLMGDIMQMRGHGPAGAGEQQPDDPSLPPNAPKYHAGGGRLGLERDAFVQAGGVSVLLKIFAEKSFVGQEMAESMDARDVSPELIATRLANCWNEALASLRELVYSLPVLVTSGTLHDDDFIAFLFTLLYHDLCFDTAAALIEEILSVLSAQYGAHDHGARWSSVAATFYLGNVPDLYKLWRSFNCRQLAHFCRILALLVFEPEDRQLLESPAVLKSIELLQIRRNRAVRAGRDATVDLNQAIVLSDTKLLERLVGVLRIMNYAPSLRNFTPYHVMVHFPFVVDTLMMLGLGELDDWDEVRRQDELARSLLESDDARNDGDERPRLSDLGAVAGMLEELSQTLSNNQRDATNQFTPIINVISAAEQAGVIVGRSRRGRRRGRDGNNRDDNDGDGAGVYLRGGSLGTIAADGAAAAMQGLASVAGLLTDPLIMRRLYNGPGDNRAGEEGLNGSDFVLGDDRGEPRHMISAPEDAANSLQLNAMLLGSYQVEALFVLCTLMGSRRKMDAQDKLKRLGLVPVLEDMFQRLPWAEGRSPEVDDDAENGERGQQPDGIHGPGCECTPESALCVQYLRLLHNFCDRDCDNYDGRLLLLSDDERRHIFKTSGTAHSLTSGLLSKLVSAFMSESDESPYRFWLASCIESYLRGSSPFEQIFVAQSGLLEYLVTEISSERLHCAGSLQTSFDLLGELGKGNIEVTQIMIHGMTERSFRKLMSVAAANLVDSNVFIRSLLLSLERYSAEIASPLSHTSTTSGQPALASRSYLTHSWFDFPITAESVASATSPQRYDWFPYRSRTVLLGQPAHSHSIQSISGDRGWQFSPADHALAEHGLCPDTIERLKWFLAVNRARLLRDLLGVVDLTNINHENICCLNTAVVIAIFAHRKHELAKLICDLREINRDEKESERRVTEIDVRDEDIDRSFLQAMQSLQLEQPRTTRPYARASSNSAVDQIGDRADLLRNFREVLFFWIEYYSHRGRDRLSLEFSSHIRFQEWSCVVSLLTADDASPTALMARPIRLPRSPYQRAPRVPDSPQRGT